MFVNANKVYPLNLKALSLQTLEPEAARKPVIRTGTISTIHKLLRSEGYMVSEYAIRIWIKRGVLPAAYSGRTAYINADNVRELLDKGMPIPPAPPKR